MSANARLQAVLAAQSKIAQKTYNSVPIADEWSVAQIVSDIARSGSRPDVKTIHGCLRHLCDINLIRERNGRYQRKKTFELEEETSQPMAVSKPIPQNNPLHKLGELAQELRQLADKIDETVLEVMEKHEKESEEYAKLTQLKSLLQSMTKHDG